MSRISNAVKAFMQPTSTQRKGLTSMFGSSLNFSSRLTGQKQQLEAYRDWVYAAARAIAEDVATVKFELYVNRTGTKSSIIGQKIENSMYLKELKAKQVVSAKGYKKSALEEIENHPILDLLYNPNPFMTKDEFMEMTVLHMELAGEAFWYIIRNAQGTPVELWDLMPNLVQIKKDPAKFIEGYAYMTPSGNTMIIEPKDILHFKYTNPNNLYRGMGTVQAAARSIDTDSHAADWNRNFFYNSAIPDMVLEADGTLTDETWERLNQEWQGKYQGTDNSHRTAILEEGLKVNVLSLAQRDMEFLEGRKFNRDQILALFRVSAHILGISENVNRANAEAAEFTFAKRVVKPKMQRITSRITQSLAPQYDEKLVVGYENPVPEDKEYLLKEKQTSVNSWKTINEIRAEMGDEPVQGGDVLYQPINLMPLGTEVTPAEETPSEGEKQLLEQNNAILRQLEELKKKDLYATDDEREKIGTAFNDVQVKIALGYEVKFLRATRLLFDKQKKIVLRNLKKRLNADKGMRPTVAKAVDLVDLINSEEAREAWYKALSPIMRANIKDAGEEALLLVGSTGFDIDDPGVVNFYEKRTQLVSKSVNEETDRLLKTSLAEGIDAGESVPQLVSRVEDIYGASAGYRAERIARTETIKASGFAQVEAWEQSGVVEGKEWFTAKDERVCPGCSTMNHETISLKQNFFNKGEKVELGGQDYNFDYWEIDTPPLHSNCRCTLLPVLISQ